MNRYYPKDLPENLRKEYDLAKSRIPCWSKLLKFGWDSWDLFLAADEYADTRKLAKFLGKGRVEY